MIDVEKAYFLIKKYVKTKQNTIKLNLEKCNGMFLAENVKSNINIPPQNNSAVDGYAVNYNSYKNNSNYLYEVFSEINAGDAFKREIPKNQCLKVSTGAHLPRHLNTVIMLEDTEKVSENTVKFPKSILSKKNVRIKGEDIKKGALVLKKKTFLRPQELGLLASINKTKIKVFKKIKIAVISNGNELVETGKQKKKSQIYDSNRPMLMSLLSQNYIKLNDLGIVRDDFKKIKDTIINLKNKYDLIIISGGASVGNKDFIVKIINEIGKVIFSTVSIKPGRPLSFGILNKKTPILILPGHPVASFVTFNIFGKYLINCMYGISSKKPYFFFVKSNFTMKKKVGRVEFLRGKIIFKKNNLFVEKYKTEGAGILSSLVWSDGLIKLESDIKEIKINDNLKFFPYEQST